MGALLGRQLYSPKQALEGLTRFVTGGKRKRNDSESDDEENNKVIELVMHTPKKVRLSTPAYIYQTLFEEGKNSDVTVEVLNHQFHLHKIYLSQSSYFASMFGGSWLESNQSYVCIDVVDSQITLNSVKIVLGSLYNNETTINPSEVISIFATAVMFQLDGLIDKCRDVMIETINPKSAMSYYDASCKFGDKKLHDKCQTWFLVNLMTLYYCGSISNLRTIPLQLMQDLVRNPNLFVVQTEFSLYTLLKFWMFAHHLEEERTEETTLKDVQAYFASRKDPTPYLLSPEGYAFAPVFRGLRVHNLISHYVDVETIQRDNIIPLKWMCQTFITEWKIMLKVNQNEDRGPPTDIDDSSFLCRSLRCGRVLTKQDRHMWRWTGFHHGMDLLMMTDGYLLSIKRSHRPDFEQLLSFQGSRRLAIRVTVTTLNEQRQIAYSQTTGIQKLSLLKGEEIKLMTFEKPVTFPLIISANILYTDLDECVMRPSDPWLLASSAPHERHHHTSSNSTSPSPSLPPETEDS